MSEGLKEDLAEIHGIGTEKAEAIIDVVEEHETDSEAMKQVERALDYFDQGDYSYGEKYLRRLVE